MDRAGSPTRPPPPAGPWLSTKDWRRSLRVARERGLSRAELRELQARLARVRAGAPPPRAAPLLRILPGGAPAAAPPGPTERRGPREAA